MKDLAAVAPLLLVAAVFVGVCITALRATDWRRVVDRRPAPSPATRSPSAGAPDTRAAQADEPVDDVTQDATDGATAAVRDPSATADDETGERPAEGSAGGRHRGPASTG